MGTMAIGLIVHHFPLAEVKLFVYLPKHYGIIVTADAITIGSVAHLGCCEYATLHESTGEFVVGVFVRREEFGGDIRVRFIIY